MSLVDIAELPRVAAIPQLSPDGQTVVYMLERARLERGPPDLPSLAAGHAGRRARPAHDRSRATRPARHDGRLTATSLLFVRAGQLMLLPPAPAAEPRAVTKHATPVSLAGMVA